MDIGLNLFNVEEKALFGGEKGWTCLQVNQSSTASICSLEGGFWVHADVHAVNVV